MQFDIILCAYKNDKFKHFKCAFESILDNDIKPQEIIIVFDGLVEDKIAEYVENLKSIHPINLIQNPQNFGLTRSLNLALAQSKSEWIVRVDADDINIPSRLDRSFHEIKKNQCDVFGSQILEIDKSRKKNKSRKVPISHSEIKKYLIKRNPMNHMTVIFRRSAVLEVGGYPNIPFAEDYALWAALIALGYKFRNSKETFVHVNTDKEFYRRRGGIKYIYNQIQLQQYLIKLGIVPQHVALANFLVRTIVQLLPNVVRKFFYQSLLRK